MDNYNHNIKVKILTFLALCFLVAPLIVEGVTLYLEPARGEYYHGEIFIITIKIDTEGECINTLEADLSFSQDTLEVLEFSQGGSILTFWMEPPSINQESGLISFVGGIPGGFCGILPGDPGESNVLGKIILKISENVELLTPMTAKIEFLSSSQVLLNDGLGTLAELSGQGADLTLIPGTPEVFKQEWQEELEKDKISPEDFKIAVSQNEFTFGGKYFLVFSTIDKQTGIDYFAIKEGEGDWERGTSPYLLKDQKLRNPILVKAVDKAGNNKIALYTPTTQKEPFPYYLVIILILAIGTITWLLLRKKPKKKNQKLPMHQHLIT